MVRRELHVALARADCLEGAVECMRGAVDGLKLDVLGERVRADAAVRQRNGLQERLDDQIRLTRELKGPLSENNIEFDEAGLVESARTKDEERAERAEKELDDAARRGRRTSNANTPPSMGSDAQSALARYRRKNAENYQGEEWTGAGAGGRKKKTGRGAFGSVRNLLREAFGARRGAARRGSPAGAAGRNRERHPPWRTSRSPGSRTSP